MALIILRPIPRSLALSRALSDIFQALNVIMNGMTRNVLMDERDEFSNFKLFQTFSAVFYCWLMVGPTDQRTDEPTDQRTDGSTDRRTDRTTDRASCWNTIVHLIAWKNPERWRTEWRNIETRIKRRNLVAVDVVDVSFGDTVYYCYEMG